VSEPYATLAGVYEWLVPDALVEPEGSAAAFAALTEPLAPGARVLDCACGTGQLAVGLALLGFEVTATDASAEMVERTRALASGHGVTVRAERRAWDELEGAGWDDRFAAVLCVGNSLVHAAGERGRRAALRAMARVLSPDGTLAVTSRNWEWMRTQAPGVRVAERLVTRGGVRGLVIDAWAHADRWEDRHEADVVVALIGDDGVVSSHGERLPYWPFTHAGVCDDIRAAGLEPTSSTWTSEVERYLVTARRPPPPPAPA
jgi:SAM-dependent methyltransferase